MTSPVKIVETEEVFEPIAKMSKSVPQSANHYGLRHLRPVNLSPMRKDLAKQLSELKSKSRSHQVNPPLVHRPESKYLNPKPIISGA